MTVQDVIMVVFAMNTAVFVSAVQGFMAQHVKISAKLKLGALNVSQGPKNLKFWPETRNRLLIPLFSIFVIMMIIIFFPRVDPNYFVCLIRMDALVDPAGQDQNVTVHVRMGDMALDVL